MKKKIWPIALAMLLAGGSAGASFTLNIDGVKKDLTVEADVVLPLRTVAEALGYKVFWDNGKTIVEKGNTVMSLIIGDTYYVMTRKEKDGTVTDLSMYLPAPYLRNNETYVPAAAFTYLLKDGQKLVSDGTALVVGGEGVIDESDEEYAEVTKKERSKKDKKKRKVKEESALQEEVPAEKKTLTIDESDWSSAPAEESRTEEGAPEVSAPVTPADDVLAENVQAEERAATARAGQLAAQSHFVNYSSLREASDAAGVSMTLPSIGAQYDSAAYRAVPAQVLEVIFGNGGQEALRIRKGSGKRDVSGDYSSYPSVKTIEVDGTNVRMKGNGNRMNLATWERNGHAYAVIAKKPLTIADMMTIVREAV